MQKKFVKRSTFQLISVLLGNVVTVDVEGDEVYITGSSSSNTAVFIKRKREVDLAAATSGKANFAVNNEVVYDVSLGRIPLMANQRSDNWLSTEASTKFVQTHFEVAHVGIKEQIQLRNQSNSGNSYLVIESVNYVATE